VLRDLNTDFKCAITIEVNLADFGHGQQLVANLLCKELARKLVNIAVYGNKDDRCIGLNFVDNRFFSQRWKCRNRINTCLHFGKDFVDILVP